MRLQGREIIVTGGGSGIGQAIAQQCAAEGANVLVADIDPTGGQATVELIRQSSGQARFVQANVTHAEDVGRMVDAALAQGGRLDALVNNAARGGGDDILLTDEAEWDSVIAIVLKSV
jgi:NAD(P)-dependent dehydrogenase (short-subunit alcohol dehydrogenase family)